MFRQSIKKYYAVKNLGSQDQKHSILFRFQLYNFQRCLPLTNGKYIILEKGEEH